MKRKPRKNPRTKLAKIAFHRQDRLSQREMVRSKRRFTFERAASTFADWSGKGTEVVRSEGLRVIAEEVSIAFDYAHEALKSLIKLNRRLGVWCTCAVAREALQYIPKGEMRPLRAIETAEDWVRGLATKEQVKKAASAAYTASDDAYASASAAAASAADAAYAAYASSADAVNAAAYAAAAVSAASAAATEFDVEAHRLVEVVAEAVMTFPARSRSNPTRRRKR